MADPDAAEPRPIDSALVRELADILADTGLTEIEVERGDLRIRVAREITVAAPAVQHVAAASHPQTPAQSAPPGATVSATPVARGDAVTSPMVGTVYLQPKPGDPPFVRAGDTVSEGQTLLIIEAMKTMNPVPAPRAGRVVEVLVDDAQPVEFGERLVVIE
mgnify:CR=1 FL=1